MIIKILKPNLLVGYEDWKTDVGHCTWTNEFVALVVYGDWKTDVGHCVTRWGCSILYGMFVMLCGQTLIMSLYNQL